MGIDTHSAGHTIEYLDNSIRITSPNGKNRLQILFLFAFLIGYLILSVVISQAILPGFGKIESRSGIILLFCVWLIYVPGINLFNVYNLSWRIFGFEETVANADYFQFSRKILKWNRSTNFSTQSVRNLRVNPELVKRSRIDRLQVDFPSRLKGRVAIDYGARTYRIFSEIDETEAARIVESLKAQLAAFQSADRPISSSAKLLPVPSPRYRINELGDASLKITLPYRRSFLLIAFMVAIVTIGSFISCFFLYLFFAIIVWMQSDTSFFLIPAICFGTFFLLFFGMTVGAFIGLLWTLYGSETIILINGDLQYTRRLLVFKRRKTFKVDEIHGLRIRPVPEPISWNYYGRQGLRLLIGGRLEFDYQGKTHKIFQDIEEAEADMIADQLRPYLLAMPVPGGS